MAGEGPAAGHQQTEQVRVQVSGASVAGGGCRRLASGCSGAGLAWHQHLHTLQAWKPASRIAHRTLTALSPPPPA